MPNNRLTETSTDLEIDLIIRRNAVNKHDRKIALLGDHEFQIFNMAIPGYLSFIEEPESWVLKDFEDIISPDVKPLNNFQQ